MKKLTKKELKQIKGGIWDGDFDRGTTTAGEPTEG